MEIVGEWFLIHRTHSSLKNIAVAAGFREQDIDFFADDTGLNLFMSIEP